MIRSNITPIRAIKDDADHVVISGKSFDHYPSFSVTVGKLIPAKPGSPAIPQKSGPNLPDYVPAVPAVEPTPERLEAHAQHVVVLTKEEWDAWTKQDDEAYIKAVVFSRLGLTPA